MSNIKCPFCNKPLQPTLRQSDEYWCENYDCSGTNIEWVGSQKLWQGLIRIKELFEIESSEHEICHTQMLKTTEKLERTRKALEIAVDALKSAHDYYEYCIQRDKDYGGDDINWDCTAMNMDNDISEALEQITALEQKD